MTTQLQSKIQQLQIVLQTKDLFAKNPLCDEFLQIIAGVKDEQKAMLYQILAPHFVDLGRENDVKKCIEALNGQEDYHSHLAAIFIETLWYKHIKDTDGPIKAFTRGIKIAEQNNDVIAVAEGYLLRAKSYLDTSDWQSALEDLNRLIPHAENVANYGLVAIAHYYIGLALIKMGHLELGMERLRVASEMAHEQHCSHIIMHIEAVRALKLLDDGKADVAKAILSSWVNEFSMSL